MFGHRHISVIIPALDEEQAIGQVIREIPQWVDQIIVVDNGSTDNTKSVAENSGARVIVNPERGYGRACLSGIQALDQTDIVVFIDGDHSDFPQDMPHLVKPICSNEADLVIGVRKAALGQSGVLTPQAIFGNWLACHLIDWMWHFRYHDLGPFRAISLSALQKIAMADRDYGWTVEMQIKALRHHLRVQEVPVRYRQRIGKSKISGTLRGVWGAGTKILFIIFREALLGKR